MICNTLILLLPVHGRPTFTVVSRPTQNSSKQHIAPRLPRSFRSANTKSVARIEYKLLATGVANRAIPVRRVPRIKGCRELLRPARGRRIESPARSANLDDGG